MTRFAIDAAAMVRIAREGVKPPAQHQLVAPSVLRSEAMALVYRAVRAGETSERDARDILDRITTVKVRVLGDRVSRGTAWRIAIEQGWDDTRDAEYIAVARLQADALIALDPGLVQRAEGLVPLAAFEALVG